jgi:isoleucyl-tRNA synthetase
LQSVTIYTSLDLAFNDGEKGLIQDELNVKEVLFEKKEIKNMEVDLDIDLSRDLVLEGMKRELIRFINNLRKEGSLTIFDSAKIYIDTQSRDVKETVEKFKKDIKNEVLAEEIYLEKNENLEIKKTVQANGEEINLALEIINK